MNVLLFNIAMYLLYVIWGFKKCNKLSIHNVIALWFLFVAVMGYVAVYGGYYQMIFGNLGRLDYTPYILCFISVVFLLYPLQKLNVERVELREFPQIDDNKIYVFLKFPLFILLLYSILLIPSTVVALSMQDMADAYNIKHIDGESLYQYSSTVSYIMMWCRRFHNWFWAMLIFYGLWGINMKMYHNGKSKLLLYLMIICSCTPIFLQTISNGGRGGFVYFTAQVVFLVLPIWTYFSDALKYKILRFSVIFVSLVLIYSISMTIARFSDSSYESPFTSVIRYFGEAYPNLGNNLWNKVSRFLEGRRMYPELFGYKINSTMSQYDAFDYWAAYCGVPVLNYKTIYGDFYLEFGPIIPLVVTFSIGFLMNLYLKKGSLSFIQLPLYSLYIGVCTTAPFWFSRRSIGDLLLILQCLFISYFIKKFIIQR